jgi:hypothetical protein
VTYIRQETAPLTYCSLASRLPPNFHKRNYSRYARSITLRSDDGRDVYVSRVSDAPYLSPEAPAPGSTANTDASTSTSTDHPIPYTTTNADRQVLSLPPLPRRSSTSKPERNALRPTRHTSMILLAPLSSAYPSLPTSKVIP